MKWTCEETIASFPLQGWGGTYAYAISSKIDNTAAVHSRVRNRVGIRSTSRPTTGKVHQQWHTTHGLRSRPPRSQPKGEGRGAHFPSSSLNRFSISLSTRALLLSFILSASSSLSRSANSCAIACGQRERVVDKSHQNGGIFSCTERVFRPHLLGSRLLAPSFFLLGKRLDLWWRPCTIRENSISRVARSALHNGSAKHPCGDMISVAHQHYCTSRRTELRGCSHHTLWGLLRCPLSPQQCSKPHKVSITSQLHAPTFYFFIFLFSTITLTFQLNS